LSRKLRAMLFEDDEILRDLVSLLLLERDFEVVAYAEPLHCPVYADAATCGCPAGATCCDLVITDVEMPRVTGLEMLTEQLARGCRVDVRYIAVMSGGWNEERLETARSLGCKTFPKPFPVREFDRWLVEVTRRAPKDLSLFNLD
jgi:DNA-binding response OmpR family regulator